MPWLTSRLRVAVALAWTTLLGLPLAVALLVLLPSRRARNTVSIWYARAMARGALRVFGVTVDCPDAPRIHAAAPAIYVMNHSSNLDPFAALAHVPAGVVGIAKREVALIPAFGQLYWLSGHLLLNRGDHRDSVARFSRLAAELRAWGWSAWLWPEGTQPRDGRLLPFKKGFVHLAIAAKLPVVPVVLHHAADVWPPRTLDVRPGRVHMEVLTPIDTASWQTETAQEHADAVRALFVARLGGE